MIKYKVNKYLLQKSFAHKRERKAVLIYYILRSYATSGTLINFSRNVSRISAETKISTSTIYRHLNFALSYGIIKKCRSGHLHFKNTENVCSLLGYAYDPRNTWIKSTPEKLELNFRTKLLKYRISAQLKKVHEKIKSLQ